MRRWRVETGGWKSISADGGIEALETAAVVEEHMDNLHIDVKN